MRLQDHIGMLSWSLLDKGLYVIYGFIFILVINYTNLNEYGLYSILIAFHTWIFTISDSFALQSLIQFGMKLENRKKVNLIGLLNHLSLTLGIALLIFLFRNYLIELFNEPRIKDIAIYLPFLTLAFIPKAFCQKLIYRDQRMFLLFISNLVFFGINTIYIVMIIIQNGILTFQSLIIGYIIGSFASSIISIIMTRRELQFSLTGEIKLKQIFNFNWKMTIGSLLYSMPRQLDTVLIKIFFSLETVGLYSAAKTVFRVFDEALNAVAALVYPSAVRHITHNRKKELETLITKTFSFGFAFFLITFIILISGGSSFLFHLPIIPLKYQPSLEYFNLLIITLPFLPFTAIYLVNIASNRIYEYFFITCIGLVVFIITFTLIGINHLLNFVPLGLVSFYITVGIIGFFYSKRILGIKYSSVFRIINDFKNYLKRKN